LVEKYRENPENFEDKSIGRILDVQELKIVSKNPISLTAMDLYEISYEFVGAVSKSALFYLSLN
jgi:hypothetical protein